MTTMRRISYEEVDTSPSTIEKEAKYIACDLGEVNLWGNHCFDGIIDKYDNYRFDDHIDEMRNEMRCQSYSHIIFKIVFIIDENPREFILFSAVLEIPNWEEIEYKTSTIYNDTKEREKIIDDLLKNKLYGKVYIRAEMETKFYIQTELNSNIPYEENDDPYEEIEEEGYEDDENQIPAIIETSFSADFCSICLTNIPNILNFPCLHLSVCESCETKGRLINCSICRKRIERKVKI